MSDVLVWGCGLIGASIGLALRDVRDVCLHDVDVAAVDEAVRRGAGRAWDGRERAALVVVAVPPALTADVLIEAQRLSLGLTYTHVCSIQSQVQHEVETAGSDLSSLVGGHPLAGREVAGTAAALPDLFLGRPWVVCPTPQSSSDAVEAVTALATDCGAAPVLLDPASHDQAVALVSHLPQAVSSALAAQLVATGHAGPAASLPSGSTVPNRDGTAAGSPALRSPVELAGPGLVDTTRLAASDASLWAQILTANAAHVGPLVRAVGERLLACAGALEVLADAAAGEAQRRDAEASVRAFLAEGNAGRAEVPVKRGERSEAFARVPVSVPDQPGTLAALLQDAAAAEVNVEDVRVEHLPGRPRGVIELVVDHGRAPHLRKALQARGWDLVGSASPS